MDDLLLTGATGLLGHYLLLELLRDPARRCRVLLRPPLDDRRAHLARLLADLGEDLDTLIASDRVRLLEGALPDRPPAAQDLRGVGRIIHAAANTAFDGQPGGEPYRTNVDGTRALLAVARKAGVPHFVHVSTAYVCGRSRGLVAERFTTPFPPASNAYEQSKQQAEQLVWAWQGDERAVTICRPTILFGDGRTGRSTAMRGLYLIARATEILNRAVSDAADTDRHAVPLRIIGRPEATINVIPVDWAARRIAAIALDERLAGEVVHVANAHPPTHTEIKQWLEAYYDLAGGGFCEETWPLAHPNHYEELFYSSSHAVHDYFRVDLRFESRVNKADERRLIDREAFTRALRYAEATGWGRRAAAPDAPRAAASPRGRVSPTWYFTDYLPRMIPRSQVARVDALTAVARFVIRDCDDGDWVCRFDHGELAEVHPAPNGLQEAFGYRVSAADFARVIGAACPVQDVFLDGDAEMFGDIDRALKMVGIMDKFVHEFPVRPPATGSATPGAERVFETSSHDADASHDD